MISPIVLYSENLFGLAGVVRPPATVLTHYLMMDL